MIKYRSYGYKIGKVFESTEERIKRGDWKSRVIGYKITHIGFPIPSPCNVGGIALSQKSFKVSPLFQDYQSALNYVQSYINNLID